MNGQTWTVMASIIVALLASLVGPAVVKRIDLASARENRFEADREAYIGRLEQRISALEAETATLRDELNRAYRQIAALSQRVTDATN